MILKYLLHCGRVLQCHFSPSGMCTVHNDIQIDIVNRHFCYEGFDVCVDNCIAHSVAYLIENVCSMSDDEILATLQKHTGSYHFVDLDGNKWQLCGDVWEGINLHGQSYSSSDICQLLRSSDLCVKAGM